MDIRGSFSLQILLEASAWPLLETESWTSLTTGRSNPENLLIPSWNGPWRLSLSLVPKAALGNDCLHCSLYIAMFSKVWMLTDLANVLFTSGKQGARFLMDLKCVCWPAFAVWQDVFTTKSHPNSTIQCYWLFMQLHFLHCEAGSLFFFFYYCKLKFQ